MGRVPWPDLSVEISAKRWRCVPDPLLCLSENGAALIRGLAAHADVWLGPEFSRILENSVIYDREPERLGPFLGELHPPEAIRHALRIWLGLRDEPGHVGGKLCWVRDALRESSLPAGMQESVVPRWEAMAEALEERLLASEERSGPLIAAMRDSAALGAVLPGALLLCLYDPAPPEKRRIELARTEQPRFKAPESPTLCRHLAAWGLPCQQLETWDDLVALERGQLLHLLVEAGLAGFLWGGLRLAVVHLVVPGALRLAPSPVYAGAGEELDYWAGGEPLPEQGAWEDARVFWYELTAEDPHARK